LKLVFWDYLIVALYIVLTVFVGLYFKKRAEKSADDFFLGGRSIPWWALGISMVATTFAADTPLAVTELVAQYGIAGNWLWWNMLIGGMFTVFFFARYWRRLNILTDLEFIELRYQGKSAAVLRGFRALYFGVFMNALVIGWVNLAMMGIVKVFFGVPDSLLLPVMFGLMLLVAIYSAVSGLLGVVYTDVFQFFLAIIGCIVLAVIVLNSPEVGGVQGLKADLPAWTFSFFPTTGADVGKGFVISIGTFLALLGVQWWSSWYPGNEPGGGGYIAQRMMSAKNEKHALGATLFFQIAHYALRPWPWIIVALCALKLYPDLAVADKKLGFLYVMRDFLPAGLKGLLLVAFFSAYMSTISTQLNWGTSYIVNDFYLRFWGNHKEKAVLFGRIVTFALMLIALFVTSLMETISGVWQFLIECGAGLGLILIIRWFWGRINAIAEIVATVAPILAYILTHYVFARFDPSWNQGIMQNPKSFFFIVAFTTIAWLLSTWLTKKETFPLPFLERLEGEKEPVFQKVSLWLSSVIFVYSFLFFTGYLILQEWSSLLWAAVLLIASLIVIWLLQKKKIKV